MSVMSWIVTLSTALMPCFVMAQESPATRGLAQTQAQNPAEPKLNQVRVYSLKYAECLETASMINDLLHNNWMQPDARTNSVLYVGPASYVEHVEKIIEKLDTPAIVQTSSNTALLPIQYRDVNELAARLTGTFRRGDLTIAADQSRSTLVLRGPENLLNEAKHLVASLDTPAGTATLEFIFLKARLQPLPSAPVIPEDLKDVEKELQRFGQIQLLGRLSTVAVTNESFRVAGSISEFIQVQAKGRLLRASPQGAQFQIEAEMHLDAADAADRTSNPTLPQKPKGPPPQFDVSTMISVANGEYVVLGTAPNGWLPGESAILVLHVMAK